ncbi:RNA-directed DNA polymerase, eukaryota [Tanacetum coccineum]
MGFDMSGCMKNMEEIIESQGVNDETKMEMIDLWCIKRCWGNLSFDYTYSEAVGTWVPSGMKMLIVSVYAPQEFKEKRMLWDYLCTVVRNWDGQVGAEIFNNFINDAGLVEVPLGGCSFTWCHKSAKKMSKLDRFLISDNLICACPNLSSISLDRLLSDHRPILMRECHGDYSIYKKRSKGGKRNLKTELDIIDKKIDRGEGNDSDINRRHDIIRLIQDIEKVDTLEMAQKAKIKWAIEGDENSKFYHGVINKKRGRCAVRGVMVDGTWLESPNSVKKEFFDHFKNRFDKPSSGGIELVREFSKRLSIEQNEILEGEVSNAEIKSAVWGCGIDKAPGPDGFTFGFYRRYWSFIENDVVDAIKWFFANGNIPKGGNSCFITLIPKIPNANMVKDFRPISLIGSVYKIIAKILANRLVSVLGDLVNEIQSAFVADRQILDGPFILNELVQWCKSKKKQSMVFKVDFEKAYDSVRWDFLDVVMKKFGFGERWCNWIQKCLQSSRGSVLVNGSPTQEFQFYKGLKQGDPLSPFLFILVMESLHTSFQRVVDVGLFKGIKLSPTMHMSHLFYADDAIFMGQWNQSNIDTLIRVLDVIYRASGIRINISKSKLLGISVEASKLDYAAAKIGCAVLKSPFTYLGSRVGDHMSRIQSWNDITEGMVSRLSKWKVKTLSMGGRLTLLKSVLGVIPIYHMSIFKVPVKVLQDMEAIRARFFNGSDINMRKSCWVSWKKVMASKDNGGLGVSSMYALNRALLFKWVWRFISQKKTIWARVIKALHGEDGKIGKHINHTYPSVWLSIIQEVESLKDKGMDMFRFISPVLGNGISTSFWEVLWRGDVAFKVLAPRIYALETMKNIVVASKLSHNDLEWSLRRRPRDGIEQAQMMLIKTVWKVLCSVIRMIGGRGILLARVNSRSPRLEAGDEKAVSEKKVMKSTATDHVFIYYAGRGGKEILDMPTVELEKSYFLATLARMDQQERIQTTMVFYEICNPRTRTRYGMSSRRAPWTGHVLVVPSSLTLQGDETSRAPLLACQESPYPCVQHNKQKRDPLHSISQLSSHQPLFHPRLEQPRSRRQRCKHTLGGNGTKVNFTGKPSGTKVNFRTLYTLGGNGIDVVVLVESIRAIRKRNGCNPRYFVVSFWLKDMLVPTPQFTFGRRWKALFLHEALLLKKARDRQKCSAPSNFVDQEEERPTFVFKDIFSSLLLESRLKAKQDKIILENTKRGEGGRGFDRSHANLIAK